MTRSVSFILDQVLYQSLVNGEGVFWAARVGGERAPAAVYVNFGLISRACFWVCHSYRAEINRPDVWL